MPAVRVDGLTKRYGQNTSGRRRRLDIETGEVVEMLEGFRTPDSGRIEVLGHDPSHRGRDWLNRIGIVLQEGGIEEELTVAESIAAQRRRISPGRRSGVATETGWIAAARAPGFLGGRHLQPDDQVGFPWLDIDKLSAWGAIGYSSQCDASASSHLRQTLTRRDAFQSPTEIDT